MVGFQAGEQSVCVVMLRNCSVLLSLYKTILNLSETTQSIFYCISVFRAALFGPFRSWLGDVLGVKLEPTVDISCAKYEYTGELGFILRRKDWYIFQVFWFVFKLINSCIIIFSIFKHITVCRLSRCSFVSRWWIGGKARCFHPVSCAALAKQRWGNTGSLRNRWWVSHFLCVCMFLYFQTTSSRLVHFCTLSSGNFQPQSISKSLVPSWNTLVLFEVSPVSFHQVRVSALASISRVSAGLAKS